MVKKRIPCYDVMKGILICLVILSHINYIAFCVVKIPNIPIMELMINQWWYVSFYMPAFFLITGVCSNFDKPFLPFLEQNIKTILVPGIAFDLLFYTLPRIISTGVALTELGEFTQRFLLFGGYFWFMTALFVSKLLYWGINKTTTQFSKWCILLVLFVIGFIGYHYDIIPNYWYICYSFDLVIFLAFGQLLKNHPLDNRLLTIGSFVIFVTIVLYFRKLDTSLPYVAADYHIKVWWKLPIHLILAITGSMLTLSVSRVLQKSKSLGYIGRNSMVFYLTNIFILDYLIRWSEPMLTNRGYIFTIPFVTLLFIATIGICACLSWLFDLKYLRILIGRQNNAK